MLVAVLALVAIPRSPALAACAIRLVDVIAPVDGSRDAALAMHASARLSDCNLSGPITYTWNLGDGNTGTGSSILHTYRSGGTFQWYVTAAAPGVSTTQHGTIQIDPICRCLVACDVFGPFPGATGEPIPFQIIPGADCCTSQPSYRWRFGDGGEGVGPATTHAYEQPGLYDWRLDVDAGSNACIVSGKVAVGPDLIAERIEVVQAVQDRNNRVRLVAEKPTFVRVHVRSDVDVHAASAELIAISPTRSARLYPVNPGGRIAIQPDPSRDSLNNAFLFELPSDVLRAGELTLRATVNPEPFGPITSQLFERDDPVRTAGLGNNDLVATVTLEAVPKAFLVLYAIEYEHLTRRYAPSDFHQRQLTSWMRRAYPIAELGVNRRTQFLGVGVPSCDQVNASLASKRAWDLSSRLFAVNGIPTSTRYYGMVANGGGFMRGCAMGIPSHVASGPTGATGFAWDSDGSFGDWYGAHELAHTWNRHHAEFCDAFARDLVTDPYPAGYVPYPYASGSITGTPVGDTALYGFDTRNRALYGPEWHDLMTYCDNQWVSDFTFEGLMDQLRTEPRSARPRASSAASDRLLVVGSIDPTNARVDLQPLFVIPAATEIEERIPGPYSIILRDAAGGELANYAFTPKAADVDLQVPDDEVAEPRTVLFIDELVPYDPRTSRVDIAGPMGTLHTVRAGPNPPQVTVVTPNGGESVSGTPLDVSWVASDPDGDPLRFQVQYSRDNGASWELVAQNLEGLTTTISNLNLPAGTRALVRVWASDGIHTASDTSDATFTVSNNVPVIRIDEPADEAVVATGQTVRLEAEAYDIDTGSLSSQYLDWYSDRDGYLGAGDTMSVTLSEGRHTIRLDANDGRGGQASSSVRVTVVADLDDLPAVGNGLVVSPSRLTFAPDEGRRTASLWIENSNAPESLPWTAQTDAAWLHLSSDGGTTRSVVVVSYVEAGLAPGGHRGTITVRSPGLAPSEVQIGVDLFLGGPQTTCRGDCDGSGIVAMSELRRAVTIALAATKVERCPVLDGDGDRRVTVDELVAAVNAARRECPGGPLTPTASRTVTATTTAPANSPTATITPIATATRSTTPTATQRVTATATVDATPTRTGLPPPASPTHTATPTRSTSPTQTPATPPSATPSATPSVTPPVTHIFCDTLPVPLAIPDDDPFGTSDTIPIDSAPGVVIDQLRVKIEIDHSWIGDISVTLLNIDEFLSVTLVDRPGTDPEHPLGCSGADMRVTLDDDASESVQTTCSETPPAVAGNYRPVEPLAAFRGLQAAGTWMLVVADQSAQDVGALVRWCLEVDPDE